MKSECRQRRWRNSNGLWPGLFPLLSTTFLSLCLCASAWAEAKPYSARYSIYRNGKLIGKSDVMLVLEEGRWTLKSESRGTHGLARLLRFRDDEHASGQWLEQRFEPGRYSHNMRVAGMDQSWEAAFDRANHQVKVAIDDDELKQFEVSPEALDPLTMKLEMRRRIAAGQADLNFHMLEEDSIEPQNFRLLEPVRLETSLGCLETIPLEKIRHASSKRYTRAWHAPELEHIEVRMEHGKLDGDHYELRITELSLDGTAVAPQPACIASQMKEAGQ